MPNLNFSKYLKEQKEKYNYRQEVLKKFNGSKVMNKTNMTFIKGNESLPTDELFQSDNMIKVRFPVNAQSKAKGIGSERMWVEVISGNAKEGIGEINNIPAFSDFNLQDLISYELNEEDGVYYFKKLIQSNHGGKEYVRQ